MSDTQAVKTGQFSVSGQTGQPDRAISGCFEPDQPDQLQSSGRLYLVADGCAGANTVAAQYAIQQVLHDFYHAKEPDLKKRLLEVIQRTNTNILKHNNQFPDRRPLAATLTAALIHENKLWVANVGDGRVYAVWDQDIEQIHEDSESKKQPESPSASATQKMEPDLPRLQMPDGLGINQPVRVDVYSRRLFPGDIVVLCNGGVSGYLSKEDIAKITTKYPPEQASRHLAELARKRGCQDNISFSITRLLPETESSGVPSPLPGAAKPAELPAQADWEALAKPVPVLESDPVQVISTLQSRWGPRQQSPKSRRGLLLAAAIVLLLIILSGLGLAAYWGWRYWQGSDIASTSPESQSQSPTSVGEQGSAETALRTTGTPATTASTDNESAIVATGQGATPNATAGVRLVAESSSPLSTPPLGGSTGDVVSSTLSSPLPAGPTPTPLPTIDLPAGCTNKGRFSDDITVEDGQEFAPGAQFDKIWEVGNEGTCPWGPGYTLRFLEGDRMNGAEQPVLTVTEPDDRGEFRVPLTAPEEAGSYQATWQLFDPTGEPFGPELYVEIKVLPDAAPPVDEAETTTLFDFVEQAEQATWLAGNSTYRVNQAPINQNLVIPFPQGIIAVGEAEFGGDYQPPGPVLLTHPHQEFGIIQGTYVVDTPLQPDDLLVATLGFPKAAVINDDGVTFTVTFRPDDGPEQIILSEAVKYEDTPLSVRKLLADIQPGQRGTFILQVDGGDSPSYDWAVWIDLRLIRPS